MMSKKAVKGALEKLSDKLGTDVAELSMAQLLKLQKDISAKKMENGKLATKLSTNERTHRLAISTHIKPPQQQPYFNAVTAKGKNSGPMEMPLLRKRAPPLWKKLQREYKPEKSRLVRDPRFDDLSGKLDFDAFNKNYKFLEEMKAKERVLLIKELRATKDEEARLRIKLSLQVLDNQTREKKKFNEERMLKKVNKKTAIEAMKQGKKPYFKKKSEAKLEMLAKRFDVLKKEKRVDKYLERKEKHKRAKELFK